MAKLSFRLRNIDDIYNDIVIRMVTVDAVGLDNDRVAIHLGRGVPNGGLGGDDGRWHSV